MEEKLYEACSNGKVEEVQKLLQNPQININWQNQNHYLRTPFYIACSRGHIDIVKLLLNDQRVDINTASNGWTPFYVACFYGHIDIVKLLLNDNRVDINKADNDGVTPFCNACQNGHLVIVKLLLNDKRVDINKKNDNGKTGLDYAKQKGNTDIVKLIDSFQNNPNETREKLTRELAIYDTQIQLWNDCKDGNIEEVRKLLQNEQININWLHYNDSTTPFYIACKNGHIDIVKLLLNDKHISIRKEDEDGKTALDIAEEENHSNIVELIKEFDTNETINKQNFRTLNKCLKKNRSIKELKFQNCGLTPSILLEILNILLSKCENGELSHIQNIKIDKKIRLKSTEGLEMIPIEILKQRAEPIIQYMLDLYKSSNSDSKPNTNSKPISTSDPLYRTKLMVVGYENVGKTTILDCLFPIIDLGEKKKMFQKTKYSIELQGNHLRKYKSKELDQIDEEIILENKQWNVQKIKETGLELIPNDKSQKKNIEIYFKDEEIRDKWIERLKRVTLNSATHGIEIQDQILQEQNQNKLSNVSELVKSIHSSKDQQNLIPNIDVSIWDFAGQHDYYNNHHYFLSTRTVFLVLWKMKDEKDGLNFWFKSLSSHLQHDLTFTNGKPYFSIIVVGTFLDDENVEKSEVLKKLREKEILEIARSNGIDYPIEIYEVSCSTLENINGLKQNIYKIALTHGYMGEKLPIGYLNIKNSIEKLRNNYKEKDIPIIEIQKLIDYCKTNSTFEFEDDFVKRGLKLLHLWGTCVYFDEPIELSNYVVLKPEFLSKEVMGKLFDPTLKIKYKNGILKHSDLSIFWPEYLDKAKMLMTLMEKFEICFKLKEDEGKPFYDQRSLIVSYLPEDKPNDLSTYWPNELSNKNEEIERTILFNMIPKEMVSRLFVCLQHTIENQSIWRYGMAFISKENKNVRAFVEVETELIDRSGNPRNSISISSNQKGKNRVAELKSSDRFNVKNQIIIKVRGENLKNRKELMDNIVEEIWKCSKKYSGVVCYQKISSPFDSSSNGLIQLSDCLLEITKPKDKQGISCPTTTNIINPIDLLLKSGMIYQREIIEEKKKEIEEAINKVKEKKNLNKDQTQELLNNPQLKTILMTEILKNKNQDSDKKIESQDNEGFATKIYQQEQKSDQNQNQEIMQILLEISKRQQQQGQQQGQQLDQLSKSIVHEVGSAVGATIHAMQEKEKHGYPSYYLLLPLIKEKSKESTSKFQKMVQKAKDNAKDLIFNRSQLHCFCEFKVRSPTSGQLQPLFHPTNSSGIEIKELNEVMKKVGPTLKVASVILQVISISAKLAAIPFPDIGGIIDQVVEYSEKAQEIFGNCEMKIESLKEMSKEDIIKRMNQNGTSELKLQPLEGDIIGALKNDDMFGEVQNGYLEKAGLYQKFIQFNHEYGNAGDVLWVCKKHYDLLEQKEKDLSLDLKAKMVQIFSSSWSKSSNKK